MKLSPPLIGRRFARLTVIEDLPPDPNKVGRCYRARCLCDCGKETIVRKAVLLHGNTKSCGCWRREFGLLRGEIMKEEWKKYLAWKHDQVKP